jgi:hypothetical protein
LAGSKDPWKCLQLSGEISMLEAGSIQGEDTSAIILPPPPPHTSTHVRNQQPQVLFYTAFPCKTEPVHSQACTKVHGALAQSLHPKIARQMKQGEPHILQLLPSPLPFTASSSAWWFCTEHGDCCFLPLHAILANSQANTYAIPERLGESCSPPNLSAM